MSAREDGGPAFPNNFGVPGKKSVGMSLRDYFAAQALAGAFEGSTHQDSDETQENATARHCYAIADAMLAERAK